MKTERFEDQIRKKLESIEPEFRESDWANFTDYSSVKLVTTAKVFTGTIFKIAASVAIVGTLFLSLAQYKNNYDLKEKIQNLTVQNGKLLNNQKQIEKYLQNGVILDRKVDKVGNNKSNILNSEFEIVEEKTNFEKGLKTEELNAEKSNIGLVEISAGNTNGSKLGNKVEDLNAGNSTKTVGKIAKTNNNSVSTTDNLANSKIENKSNINLTNLNESKIYTKNSSKNLRKVKANQTNIFDENSQYTIKNNKNIKYRNSNLVTNDYKEGGNFENNEIVVSADIVENSKMNFNYLNSKGLSIDSTKNLRRLLKKSDFGYYKLPEKKKAYFTLADAYLRVGVNCSISKGTTNYGLVGEIFLDQRISISSGFYTMKHKTESYITTYNYQKVKHYDFKDKYKEKLLPSKEILNINEKTDLAVVPVHINYNHPISNSFKLIASVGTELDIKGLSRVDYNYSGPMNLGSFQPQSIPVGGGSMFESGAFNSKIKAKLFNNIYLGIGAEKQFGKFALQAKAYDNFLVKEVDYRKSTRLGLELGLFYRL